jgi:hypothetical protein
MSNLIFLSYQIGFNLAFTKSVHFCLDDNDHKTYIKNRTGEDYGIIQSPNYPNNYSKNKRCFYLITGKSISFQFYKLKNI